jgi:hypothetical protein
MDGLGSRLKGQSPALVVVLGIIGVAAVVMFDLGPPLAFNDDWVYAWTVSHFAATHRFVLFPEDTALPYVQLIWSIAVGLGHSDPRLLRLTEAPFLLLLMGSTWYSTRLLGADRFWSAAAAVGLGCNPIVLSLATTFMTDIPYAALLALATALGLRWILTGRGGWLMALVATLATLQRQLGVGIAPALLLGMLVARGKGRSPARSDWAVLAATFAGTGLALAMPHLLGLGTDISETRMHLLSASVFRLLGLLITGLLLLGLYSLPFASALWSDWRRDRPGRALVPVGLAAALLWGAAYVGGFRHVDIFPGDYLTARDLGSPELSGVKPQLYPTGPWIGFEVLVLDTLVTVLVIRRRMWTPAALGASGIFMLAVAALQVLPLLLIDVYDRYTIPIAVAVVPLLAWQASARTGRWPRLAAISVCALMLVIYVVGEQDYQAWEQARDVAAHEAYRVASPSRVDAGFEANGVYWLIPQYDRTGTLPPRVLGYYSAASLGPAHPDVRLTWGSDADPRPGITYASLRPGKIVIVDLRGR